MDTKVLKGLLNPVRMRILQILLKKEKVTTKDIAEELGEIPPASLYRHIKAMLKDDIIEIVEEVKKRGTLEKVYALKSNPLKSADEAVKNKDTKALFDIYYTFTMTALMDFNQYLERDDFDLIEDKVGFRSFPLYLDDEEASSFVSEFSELISKYSQNKKEGHRKMRKFSFMFVPTEE